jgi:hypothetical protein
LFFSLALDVWILADKQKLFCYATLKFN